MTKGQRKRLRELAAVAHERDLGVELTALEGDFRRWRDRAITAFDLSDRIHAFHQGPSRKLFTIYDTGGIDIAVAGAIARGVISEVEAGPDMVNLLATRIAFFRHEGGEGQSSR